MTLLKRFKTFFFKNLSLISNPDSDNFNQARDAISSLLKDEMYKDYIIELNNLQLNLDTIRTDRNNLDLKILIREILSRLPQDYTQTIQLKEIINTYLGN